MFLNSKYSFILTFSQWPLVKLGVEYIFKCLRLCRFRIILQNLNYKASSFLAKF